MRKRISDLRRTRSGPDDVCVVRTLGSRRGENKQNPLKPIEIRRTVATGPKMNAAVMF